MSDFSSMSDADLLAQYKAAKPAAAPAPAASPIDAALSAEGIQGPVADIARSIYQQESGSGKNTKTSNAGAVGGMQIIPSTFKSVADKDWNINDPTQNARAGVRYIEQLYQQAGGDPALTAAGYYGGPGGLEKARQGVAVADPRNPNAPTTLQYGQQVAARLPKDQGLVAKIGNAVTDAIIPSANAAEVPAPAASPFAKMSDADLLAQYKAAKAGPAAPPVPPSILDKITDGASRFASGAVQGTKDLAAGAVRGAGSIGATLLAPVDMASDAMAGKGLSLASNDERRAQMDEALKSLGANPNSLAYKAGKLGTEIAGTAGTGGVLAEGAQAAGAAPAVINALRSGGMTLGGAPAASATQVVGNALTRVAGGVANGAVSAGLVNPHDAGPGALAGGVLPAVASAIAPAGRAIGNRLADAAAERTADLSRRAPLIQTLQDGIGAGYVVPPSSVDHSLWNTVKESVGGKIATAQTASARNQDVTDRLVRQSLGLAEDAPLSVDALRAYRTAQTQAGYDPLRRLGMVPADQQFDQELTNIIRDNTGHGTIPAVVNNQIADLANAHRSGGFHAGDAIDAMRQLRENAADAFRNGNTALGRTNRAISDAYEGMIERAIPANQPELLQNFQEARANMARSFTVEDALKEGTGAIDARKLASALQGGAPLDGELLTAARFASAFPKATQPPSLVAGPGVHNLKAGLAAMSAGAGASALGPIGAVAGAAYPFLVPPAVRAQMFSARAQNALIPRQGGNQLLQLSQNPATRNLLELGARSAPVLTQDH